MRPKATTGRSEACLERLVEGPEEALRHGRGWDLHPEAGERAGVAVEVVHEPGRLERLGHAQPVVEAVAEGRVLVEADADAQGNARAHRLAERLEDLDGQPHPLLERAAIRVGALVEVGRGEAAQQPVVGDLDLDPVEPRGHHVAAGCREPVDGRADVAQVHGARRVAARRLGHLGGRPEHLGRLAERGVPRVGDLADHARALAMDLVHDAPVRLDPGLLPGPDVVGRHHALGHHRHVPVHDEPGTAQRPLHVVGPQRLVGHAVVGHDGRVVGLEHDPVAQRHVRELERGEQPREARRRCPPRRPPGQWRARCVGAVTLMRCRRWPPGSPPGPPRRPHGPGACRSCPRPRWPR